MPQDDLENTDMLMVTAHEAARMLSISAALVYELAAGGVLERRYIGRRNFRIPVDSLRRYVASLPDEPETA